MQKGSLWEMTEHARVITLIGAGGKTTSLQRMGQEIQAAGLEAVLTTTTKVWPFQDARVWRNPYIPPPSIHTPGIWFWYASEEHESGKWRGPEIGILDHVLSDSIEEKNIRVWVIEGDGAKEKSLKFWAEHEPQIPSHTDCSILVVDGSVWGNRLSDVDIHRPEYGRAFSGRVFDAEFLWEYLLASPVFSPGYTQMQWVVVLNEKGLGELADVEGLSLDKHGHELLSSKIRPRHLRLAAGDCRAGEMRWVELW